MVSTVISQHMARIGSKGGKGFKPGSDVMRSLANRSWSPEARAKRLSKQRAKDNKSLKINNNKDVA